MDREKITLTGAPETMLATLYGRALDSRRTDSILHDAEAARAVRRIDYDFRKTKVQGSMATSIAIRARVLDDWTRAFLARHPSATVVHLACGLDTRAQRLAPPAGVRWVDVDFPEVIDLRTRLLPTPAGDYRMIGSSVTSDEWLESVPADRPTAVVFEGLSMYLRESEGKRLIERLVSRFPSGELQFDGYGSMGIKMQRFIPAVRNAGATLYWGIDDPHVLEGLHEDLRLVESYRSLEMPYLDRLPLASRLGLKIVAHLPKLRDMGWMMRYEF